MAYIAHRREDGAEQTLLAHLQGTAALAGHAVSVLENTGYLAGILHDFGKNSNKYQQYLLDVTSGVPRQRGSVNHTFAGVRFVLERWHKPEQSLERQLTAELLAFAMGSHHVFFDCFNSRGENGFDHRLTSLPDYDEVKKAYFEDGATLEELDDLFAKAVQEVAVQFEKMKELSKSPEELLFYLQFLGRLLASAVIQGDRQNTAEFMKGLPEAAERLPPWNAYFDTLEENLANKNITNTPINRARQQFSDHALQRVDLPAGIYPLPLPTGGGKTLTSLRYALGYASAHPRVKRIFFVIPLLSILEQNVKGMKEALGETIPVLEHHSNLVREEQQEEALDENELLLESWGAPIIVTTLVQLLNTLFAGKTSCVRRMQALTDSVIVIDEVQAVPKKLLSLFHLSMNALAHQYGATVILSSATQPCTELTPHALMVETDKPLVPYDKALWDLFARTQLLDATTQFGYTADELASMVLEKTDKWGSNLTICNTKAEARILYERVKNQTTATCFFLSTDLCPAHREAVIEALKNALDSPGESVICISTQIMEAGVDVSFGSVIRILAGMDSAVQSAGRCNRHGEFGEKCPVYLVKWNGENLGGYLEDILLGQVASHQMLSAFQNNPAGYENDLASETVVKAYYQCLYSEMKANSMDYPMKGKPTMLEMLSTNITATKGKTSSYCLQHQAKTAGENFTVFDKDAVDILVPYTEKGAKLIANLSSKKAQRDVVYVKQQLEQAKRYTISIYQYQKRALDAEHALVTLPAGNILALLPNFYSQELGCTVEKKTLLEFWEV